MAVSTTMTPGLGLSSAVTSAGHSWSTVPGNIEAIDALSCASRSFCVAVGGSTGGEPDIASSGLGGQAYVYSDGSWSAGRRVTSPEVGLNGVSCVSPAFCAAVGDDGHGYVYRGGR